MKRKVIMLLTCVALTLGLCACNAEDVNGALNKGAEAAGLTTRFEVQQEDLDKVNKAVEDVADTVKDVVEDEDVQAAVKSAVDTVIDVVNEPEKVTE